MPTTIEIHQTFLIAEEACQVLSYGSRLVLGVKVKRRAGASLVDVFLADDHWDQAFEDEREKCKLQGAHFEHGKSESHEKFSGKELPFFILTLDWLPGDPTVFVWRGELL